MNITQNREQYRKEYAAKCEAMFDALCAKNGVYTRLYNTYRDLSLIELDGAEMVKNTASQMFKEHEDDYKYLTELTIALNWKCWSWYDMMLTAKEKKMAKLEPFSRELSKAYSDLYHAARNGFYDIYEGEEEACEYFFRMTD